MLVREENFLGVEIRKARIGRYVDVGGGQIAVCPEAGKNMKVNGRERQ